jgi:formylglycine-generating enzyme required for sulfatase activity
MGDRGDIVTVADFWMDETPVTVAQYKEAVKAGACTPPYGVDKNQYSNWNVPGRENHPVNCIDWHQACAYAKWAGKRLPSEEEWEWAARGRDEARVYPWGNEEPSDQLCWDGEGNDLDEGNRKSTSPVGSYPNGDSRDGLKDMAGNVWEWTINTYASNSDSKVNRGGCWYTAIPVIIPASYRCTNSPSGRYSNLGVRCVRSNCEVKP